MMISRRRLLGSVAGGGVLGAALPDLAAASPAVPTPLAWLDGAAPAHQEGTTFGIPWPKGQVRRDQSFRIVDATGTERAVQTWPIAYWPDGSMKWSAHAVAAGGGGQGFRLAPGASVAAQQPLTVLRSGEVISISSGALRWTVQVGGANLITEARRGDRVVLQDVRLTALTQNAPDLASQGPTGALRSAAFTSRFDRVTIEQQGPVRAVIKLDGVHTADGRDWLPVSVRLYFYAGSDAVRIVHSFIFDGDPAKDFIRGLGVVASVPMEGDPFNRHVRFAGDGPGVFGEAVRTLTGLGGTARTAQSVRDAQVAGRPVMIDELSQALRDGARWIPQWGEYSLSQLTPEGYALRKRTTPAQAWIDVNFGERARGLAYVGGPNGGVALGLKDFWQRTPTGLSIAQAQTDMARITAWLWSPDAPAMDLRPYRATGGMDSHEQEIQGMAMTYEDYEAGWNDAHGVARTSELMLWALPSTPSHQTLSTMAQQVAEPARLVTTPERLKLAGVFGDWSLVDRSTPARQVLEDRLDYLTAHYMREVEQRRWYGFWSYGDVMHTYDSDRHMWRYDVGGFAWDNSELSTDLWLWYSYLRTGRADLFRFAEAMTRHTGEVDVYHLGRFKGFGTRHGVQHWSDSSKQPRVSNVAYRRIYYYLTADERVGDLMRDLVASDQTLKAVDISRKLPPSPGRERPQGAVALGFGTSWGAFLAAWLTEWERTGERRWRDRILNGMTSIAAMNRRWFAGEAPYDLATGRFLGLGGYVSVSHLNAVFGVVEMNAELLELIDVPAYRRAWLEYCRYYSAPAAELKALLGEAPRDRSLTQAHSRLTAYAARQEKDPALAMRAWSEFFGKPSEAAAALARADHPVGGVTVLRPLVEDATVSTNAAAQWSLAAIQNLDLVGYALDEGARAAGVTQ